MLKQKFIYIAAATLSGVVIRKIFEAYQMEEQNQLSSRINRAVNNNTEQKELEQLLAGINGTLGVISFFCFKNAFAFIGGILSFFVFWKNFEQSKRNKKVSLDRVLQIFSQKSDVKIKLYAGFASFASFLIALV